MPSSQDTIRKINLQILQRSDLFRNPSGYYFAYPLTYFPADMLPDGGLVSWEFAWDTKDLSIFFTSGQTLDLSYPTVGDFDIVEAIAISRKQRFLAIGAANGTIFA